MTCALVLALAAGVSQAPQAPQALQAPQAPEAPQAPQALQAPQMPSASSPEGQKVIAVRKLFAAEAGVLLWLRADDDTVRLEGMEPLWQPLRIERFPEPIGDGIWVELLSHRLELMAAFRGTVPPPGGVCGLELPVLRGTWFVLLIERRGDETRILGQIEVGPKLMRLVEEQKIPMAG